MVTWYLFKLWKATSAFVRRYQKQCMATLILGVVIYFVAMIPRVSSLLPSATRVVDISEEFPYYWWLSSEELLIFRKSDTQQVMPIRYHIAMRKEWPLKALQELFRKNPGKPETVQVSPNGKWLLWTDAKGQTQVATLDGTRSFHVSSSHSSQNRWLRDSLHWVELVSTGEVFSHANFYSVDRPNHITTKPVFPPFPSTSDQTNIARIAIADDEYILVHYWNEEPGKLHPSRIIAATFTPNPLNRGKFSFTTPRTDYERGALLFAPQTKRIAWILEFYQHFPPYSYTGFWSRKLDMVGVREIGYLKAFGWKHRAKPLNVQWLPDGRRLSFVYQNTLWIVPAE